MSGRLQHAEEMIEGAIMHAAEQIRRDVIENGLEDVQDDSRHAYNLVSLLGHMRTLSPDRREGGPDSEAEYAEEPDGPDDQPDLAVLHLPRELQGTPFRVVFDV